MSQAEHADPSLFAALMAEYYLLLDGLDDLPSLRAWYTDDAVWECWDHAAAAPTTSLGIDALHELALRSGHAARAARLRHHLTGVLARQTGPDAVRSVAKVLVTQQPLPAEPPSIRETAIVTADWLYRQGAWRIARWRIDRDSIG